MGTLVLTQAILRYQTRRATDMHTYLNRSATLAGAVQLERDHDLQYPNAKPRKVGPCNTYNCHGLSFGARRGSIVEVMQILEEDDYYEIDVKDVLPGDIAVYFSTGLTQGSIVGDPEHSGIVLERTQLGSVKILSKWGPGDERVHFLGECPYDHQNVGYFRINDRSGPQPGKSVTGRKRPGGRKHAVISAP